MSKQPTDHDETDKHTFRNESTTATHTQHNTHDCAVKHHQHANNTNNTNGCTNKTTTQQSMSNTKVSMMFLHDVRFVTPCRVHLKEATSARAERGNQRVW
jgi:hypothetical protein